MNNELSNVIVGILFNPDYSPSVLAREYIYAVLQKIGVAITNVSFNDLLNKTITCDTLFNVHYGDIGDGGLISGVLEKQGIPFIGNNQYTCALMLNKIVSKKIFERNQYLTPRSWYQLFPKKNDTDLTQDITASLAYPMLAKPVCGAASENIHLLSDKSELKNFITTYRFLIDSGYYFFEEFIHGRELSTGFVNAVGELLPVIEIRLKDQKYQSNVVKFSPGLKENIIPAPVPPNVYMRAQEIAHNLHYIFGCLAFSRTDMMYDEINDNIYILEINTNPGLLEKSLLPLMVKTLGIDDVSFFTQLIISSLQAAPRSPIYLMSSRLK